MNGLNHVQLRSFFSLLNEREITEDYFEELWQSGIMHDVFDPEMELPGRDEWRDLLGIDFFSVFELNLKGLEVSDTVHSLLERYTHFEEDRKKWSKALSVWDDQPAVIRNLVILDPYREAELDLIKQRMAKVGCELATLEDFLVFLDLLCRYGYHNILEQSAWHADWYNVHAIGTMVKSDSPIWKFEYLRIQLDRFGDNHLFCEQLIGRAVDEEDSLLIYDQGPILAVRK